MVLMPESAAAAAERTARQRLIKILEENPDGLSKSELKRRVGGNAGAFRRLLSRVVDAGEVIVHTEDRPTCGPTRVHRLARHEAPAA